MDTYLDYLIQISFTQFVLRKPACYLVVDKKSIEVRMVIFPFSICFFITKVAVNFSIRFGLVQKKTIVVNY